MFPSSAFPKSAFPSSVFPPSGTTVQVAAAAGTSTATAVGRASSRGVGAAAGTSIAIAISNAPRTGSAAGTCTVLGVGQSTAVAVGSAAGTSTATHVANFSQGGDLYMELNGYGGGWTKITDWMRNSGIRHHRGFSGSEPLDLVAVIGVMSFTLDNSSTNSAGLVGYYGLDHANKRTGFAENIRVQYRLGTQTRFTGTLDVAVAVPGTNQSHVVNCEVVSWMDIAQREILSDIAIQSNIRADDAFQFLLDSIPAASQPAFVVKETSTETFPYVFDRIRDTQTVLRDEFLRSCRSTLDRIWERGNGTLVYESRVHRATLSNNVDTFTDHNGFVPNRDRDSVINSVKATVHPRLPGTVSKLMYQLNAPMQITLGAPVTITGPWTDVDNPNVRIGAVSLEPLVAGVDYTANTLEDGSGTDLTPFLTLVTAFSGNASSFTFTLNGGVTSGWITSLRQLGVPLYDYGATIMSWKDDTSIARYKLKNVDVDMPYQGNARFGLQVGQYIVYTNKTPLTKISGFKRVIDLNDPVEILRSIDRDISDRITIVDAVTGIDATFFIDAIEESVKDGYLITEWLLGPADTTLFWLLGVTGRSELGLTTRPGFGAIVGAT